MTLREGMTVEEALQVIRDAGLVAIENNRAEGLSATAGKWRLMEVNPTGWEDIISIVLTCKSEEEPYVIS